jgi:hypothetical protein
MRYTRTSSRSRSGETGTYSVYSEKRSGSFPRGYPTGSVGYNYHYPKYDVGDNRNPEEPHKPVLFREFPAEVHIKLAFADPAVRHAMPTVMSRLHLDHPGAKLVADSDLSKHSSRLAKHAQDLGFPVTAHPTNPTFEIKNDADFEERHSMTLPEEDSWREKIIPAHEVAEARQFIRDKIRKPKPHLSAQFDHPQLPGLEDY